LERAEMLLADLGALSGGESSSSGNVPPSPH
jgi:hypothetical protein